MRRVTAALLLLLLLCGCAPHSAPTHTSADPELSAQNVLAALLAAAPEAAESPEVITDGDALELYPTLYGLDESGVLQCAVARLGGARVFELTVIQLAAPSDRAEEALSGYLLGRWADFAGYAPAEAATAEKGLILSNRSGTWLALVISSDPDAVAGAFQSCFDGSTVLDGIPDPSPEPEPTVSPSQPLVPEGRLPYTDPNIDDMTVYDTTAILDAWRSGDPGGLSDYDRTILDAARTVISQVISEDMSPLEMERAIYRWITQNVAYDYDHYDPMAALAPESSTPYNPLVEGKGICLGFAVTFQLFMDMLDVPCITVIGAANQSLEDHAWNMVSLDGRWYCVDSTWDTGLSEKNWRYFNVTSDWLAERDHQWDYGAVPEATATDHGGS